MQKPRTRLHWIVTALLLALARPSPGAGVELSIDPARPEEGQRIKVTLRLTSPYDGAAILGRLKLSIEIPVPADGAPDTSPIGPQDMGLLMELEGMSRNFLEESLMADALDPQGDGSLACTRHWEVDVMPAQAARMPRPSLLTGATKTDDLVAKAILDQQPYVVEWSLLAMVPAGAKAVLSAQGRWYSAQALAQAHSLFVPDQDPSKLQPPPPVLLQGNKPPPAPPPPVHVTFKPATGAQTAAELAGAILKPADEGEEFKADAALETRAAAVPMVRALGAATAHPDCMAWLPTARRWIVPTESGCAVVSTTNVEQLPRDYSPWIRGVVRSGEPAATVRESWIGGVGRQVRQRLKAYPSHREKGGDAWDVPLSDLPSLLIDLDAMRSPADVNGNVGAPAGE